jgi:CRISP-associated protein Cas1
MVDLKSKIQKLFFMSSINSNQLKRIFTIIANPQCQDKLKLSNSNLAFESNDQLKVKIPISRIQLVLIIGEISITTQLIQQLSQNQINIVFLRHNFSPYFSTSNQSGFGDKELKLAQYRIIIDPSAKLQVATAIIRNKISNQSKLLKSKKINLNYSFDNPPESTEQLMGIEGAFSSQYFQLLFSKIGWRSRIPRAKSDIPNWLLDIGYTYLFNIVSTFCTQLGFENTFGFLHADYYQRQSLVCDLMEPMRPIIDQTLLNAYSRKQIKTGIYTDIFGKVIVEYQDRIYAYLRDFGDYLKDELDDKTLPIFEL